MGVMERRERREREFKIRRAEILEQAERAFSAKGFHNVTMAEIASASGFSIGCLYQFFPGKQELYATMISDKLNLVYDEIRQKVRAAHDPKEKITRLVAAHFEFVENNTDFCKLILRGENLPDSEVMMSLRRRLMDGYLEHVDFLEAMLSDCMKSGFLRYLNPRQMAALLFGLIRSTAIDWMFIPDETSLRSKEDFILDVFLSGVKK